MEEETKLDRFARYISEPPYPTPGEAAERMGLAYLHGNKLMQRLRAEVGLEQAR